MHTGTGRIARLKMYPMSLYESGESNGQISLKMLFERSDADIDGITSPLSIEQLILPRVEEDGLQRCAERALRLSF